MRLKKKAEMKDVALQMTSMIDVVFLLLIFFMCVTEMNKLEAESLTLPIAYKARDDSDPPKGRVTVNIVRAGGQAWEFHVNKENKSIPELGNLIRARVVGTTAPDGTSTLSVKIRADADCPYKYVQKVMMTCAENRVWQVSFGVQAREIEKTPKTP